ncbi:MULTISPECIES: TIGR04222 domain-containing membrane protein [unclassified Streptomyces]|uniref:TIGR04222 domain-containing membrane protein n=1 Tax=unclassified Streptomyces TaxID=2593676 RepID=UPI0038222ABC
MSWLAWTCSGIAVGLLAAAAVLLRAPRASLDEVTDPYEAAYLRDGPRGAATVALLALHLRGTVDAGPHGTARISGAMAGLSHPLQLAVYKALYRPSGVNGVTTSRSVRRETDALRERLAGAGLVRRGRGLRTARMLACAAAVAAAVALVGADGWGPVLRVAVPAALVAGACAVWAVPRRTRAGRRALRRTGERFPLTRSRSLSPESALLAAALHGAPALLAAAPHFTRDSGLLGRDRTDSLYVSRTGTSGGGGFSCGG